MQKPELLSPSGNLEKLKIAFLYGADAVYIGGEEFSMRTACDNFTSDEMQRGIEYAHRLGKKVYVAANVVIKNNETDKLAKFAEDIYSYGADAVIISDLGALDIFRKSAPELNLHISTQANTNNYTAASMWYSLGAKRVVLARELTGSEIKKIRSETPSNLELECFVHGAMCVSYSGRCLLSSYMTGRDANKGNCAQSCRWNYYLMEEKRPGEYMQVVENDSGSFFFNSKDLCLIEYIPELIDSGVTSFKIEGRVKNEYYVATVTKAYREEIDRYCDNPQGYIFDKTKLEELCKVSHRHYSHGFWNGAPKNYGQIYESSSYIRTHDIAGIVQSCDTDGNAVVSQRNKFSVADRLEIMRPLGDFITMTAGEMRDKNDNIIQSAAHAQMTVKLKLPVAVPTGSILRKEKA